MTAERPDLCYFREMLRKCIAVGLERGYALASRLDQMEYEQEFR